MGGGWTGGWEAGPGKAPAGGRPPGPLAPTGGDALNFFVLRANFLTTLCSHLDVTCSCYFWSTLFNVDVIYIYI